MQDFIVYSWNEFMALVVSVLIGTGAYAAFIKLKKNQRISFSFIVLILFINFFVTWTISAVLQKYNWGEYRVILLPVVAFSGQYIMDWFDKRYLKIFDAGLKKAGLNLEKENETENETVGDVDSGEN